MRKEGDFLMEEKQEVRQIQELRVKAKRIAEPVTSKKEAGIEWRPVLKRHRSEEVMKNMAVAAALVLCAAVLRSGAVPQLNQATDVIMTAVTGDTLLDENLGKLSFVSSMFPEATLVFGEQTEMELSMPVMSGSIVHAWNEEEPYVSWRTEEQSVRAVANGEVTAIFHGNGDERVIQVTGEGGLTCLYGNLASCSVTVGDPVSRGDTVGMLMDDAACVLEVRQNGYSIDPSTMMEGAS